MGTQMLSHILLAVFVLVEVSSVEAGGSRGGSAGGTYKTRYLERRYDINGRNKGIPVWMLPRDGRHLAYFHDNDRADVRYSRKYVLSYYPGAYYKSYFYHSRTYTYLHRPKPHGDVYVCANYEANDNGTYMGVFTCPNSWEPENFVFCCGLDYSEYCCGERTFKYDKKWYAILGIAVAVLFVVIALVYVVGKIYTYKTDNSAPTTSTARIVHRPSSVPTLTKRTDTNRTSNPDGYGLIPRPPTTSPTPTQLFLATQHRSSLNPQHIDDRPGDPPPPPEPNIPNPTCDEPLPHTTLLDKSSSHQPNSSYDGATDLYPQNPSPKDEDVLQPQSHIQPRTKRRRRKPRHPLRPETPRYLATDAGRTPVDNDALDGHVTLTSGQTLHPGRNSPVVFKSTAV